MIAAPVPSLGDGADDDLLSDGCVRVGTLNDLKAEWTDASGTRLFVSLQQNVTGHGVVLEISGSEVAEAPTAEGPVLTGPHRSGVSRCCALGQLSL